MSRTAIVTDTNSGITPEEGKTLGVFVVPMPVLIDGSTYFEGTNIDHKQLFQAMHEDRDISTSQPAIGEVTALWDEILGSDYDEIIYLPMSSGLSGSCASAAAIAQEYEGRVEVADIHRISITLRHAVLDAHYLAAQGNSAAQIKQKLEENAYNSVVYLGVDTLKYFRKNGRCTAAAAAIATVLNLKPILITEGGKFDTFAKTRGIKGCKSKIIDAVKAEMNGRFKAFPASELQIATAGSFETQEEADAWKHLVQETFPDHQIVYVPLSCSIACHTGIGAIGIGISRILHDGSDGRTGKPLC